jgi:hypothetical protein
MVGLSVPAPDWLRELAEARANYQELLGWPVSVRVGERNLVVAVGREIDAVTMPAGLGAGVRALLGYSAMAPILVNSDGEWWTFFAKPAMRIVDDLSAVGVYVAPAGSYVPIPAGLGERWVQSPAPNRALPLTGDVLAAARRLGLGKRQGRSA